MRYAYAPFHARLLAQILNLMLIVACLSPLLYLFNYGFQPSPRQELAYTLFIILRSLLVFSLAVVSMSWFGSRFGGSPGKVLMGLEVVAEKSGQHLSFIQTLTRVILALVSMASLLGVLFMLFDTRRRCLHDRLMGTVVLIHEADYAETTVDLDYLDQFYNEHP